MSDLLCIEVFVIVKDMLDHVERAVESRVRKMLSADFLKVLAKTLGRFVNEAPRVVIGF